MTTVLLWILRVALGLLLVLVAVVLLGVGWVGVFLSKGGERLVRYAARLFGTEVAT